MPDLLVLVSLMAVVALLGQALDALLRTERLADWRWGMAHLWARFDTHGAAGLTADAHALFCDLFDAVYGRRALTRQRAFASILSTGLALLVLTLVLGYENTYWRYALEDTFEPAFDWEHFLLLAVSPLVLNLVPDFFSLVETRWVLERARHRGTAGVAGMLLLDLALTLIIFALGVGFMYLVDRALIESLFQDPRQWADRTLSRYFQWLFEPAGGLIFLLSTFVTSAFWLLYVLSFALIRFLHHLLPAVNAVYYQIGRSQRPALTASAFFNGLLVLGLSPVDGRGLVVGLRYGERLKAGCAALSRPKWAVFMSLARKNYEPRESSRIDPRGFV